MTLDPNGPPPTTEEVDELQRMATMADLGELRDEFRTELDKLRHLIEAGHSDEEWERTIERLRTLHNIRGDHSHRGTSGSAA